MERRGEHKTDHSVTAHFPAHYRQQVLMGDYNEGPCLGRVMGEYSPNSYASIFCSISPSYPLFPSNIPPPSPAIYYCTSPEACDLVCPLTPPFCNVPPAILHCSHPTLLSPLRSPFPVTLFVSSSHDSQLIFHLFGCATSTTCLSCSPFSSLFFPPFAPPGNNLDNVGYRDVG